MKTESLETPIYMTDPCAEISKNCRYWQLEAETKWRPFCRRLFKNKFLKCKVLYFDSIFITHMSSRVNLQSYNVSSISEVTLNDET